MKAILKYPKLPPEVVDVEATEEMFAAYIGPTRVEARIASDVEIVFSDLPEQQYYNCNILGWNFCGPILAMGLAGGNYAPLSDDAFETLWRLLGGEA